jgi:ABC-type transporter Mla subunit MlaD
VGLFDKAKELASQHAEKVEEAIDKVADVVDDKTGGKYSEKIDKGAEAAKGFVAGDEGDQQEPPSRLTP